MTANHSRDGISPAASTAPLVATFGSSSRQSALAAAVLAIVLAVGGLFVSAIVSRPGSPGYEWLLRLGLGPGALPVGAIAAAIGIALWGFFRAGRLERIYRVAPEGLVFEDRMGRYLLEWSNVEDAALTPGGALGLRVRDLQALLRTHSGSPEQLLLLSELPRVGGWDLFLRSGDVGCPIEEVWPLVQGSLLRARAVDAGEREPS